MVYDNLLLYTNEIVQIIKKITMVDIEIFV